MVIEERQNDRIDSLAFTPDGQMLAAASAARAVTVWSVRDRSLLRTLRIPTLLPPLSVEWSARGKEIAIGQTSSLLVDAGREAVVAQFLNKYGSGTGSYLRRVPGHPGQAWIGVDGNDMALFGDDRKIAATLRWPSGTKEAGAWVKQIAVSSDGRVAAVAAASKGVFLWDVGQPASEARSVAIDGDAIGVAITPRGDRAFVAVRAKNAAPRIDVVDVAAARVASTLDMGPDAAKDGDWVTTIAVSNDGAVAVAGSLHRVTAWTVATGARRWVVDADRVVVRSRHDLQSSVQAIAFSPTEPLLAAANARGDVFFLDPRNGRLLGELGVEVRRPHTLLFSEDSRSLLTLSAQHASRWSIDEGRLVGANLAPGVAAASRLPKGDFLIGRSPLSLQIAMPTDPPPACPVGTVPIFLAPWSQPDDLAALPGFVSRGIRVVSGSAAAAAPDPTVTSSAPLCIPNAFTLYDLNVPTKRALVQFLNDAVGVVGTADKRVVTLKGSKEFRFANALSLDGKRATGSNLEKVLVWDASTGDVQTTIPIPGGAVVLATAFSRDGTRIAVANGRRSARAPRRRSRLARRRHAVAHGRHVRWRWA